ncbi:RAMP superfamily CRISPR-associated protein [candidate division KSB1 bacterium]|nr:RAMP superfamily CRISPR-associated protein [candidate division KSB1 bacterium]
MPKQLWSGDESRRIIKRIVVEVDLVLETPAHFGNGDTDDLTDMPLVVDPFDGRTPLLTGASIAGALRSYLRAREKGYGQRLPNPKVKKDKSGVQQERTTCAVKLFGGFRADDEGEQSALIIDDALGKNFGVEMRDGVKLNSSSRTAQDDTLYNLELWQAGTIFPLRFELLIREKEDDEQQLKQALTTALFGLTNGSITLGARKRRGYGRVTVEKWRIKTYDLKNLKDEKGGLLDWIKYGGEPLKDENLVTDIRDALNTTELGDSRKIFFVYATFSLDGSVLIRSGGGKDDTGPDMVHLHALQRDGNVKPILSGTSLAGTLRARALKIANTIGTSNKANKLIDSMFGPDIKPGIKPGASRVIVEEYVIDNAKTDLVQNRVSIDRFTGGARETALFDQQPAFGGDDTTVTVNIRLLNPEDHEIGLLLLLLKDLWTGDLPLGGESSVGRGRLRGKLAELHGVNEETWKIEKANGKTLTITGNRDHLQQKVDALKKHLQEMT